MKKALIACTVISIMLVSFACTSVRHRFIVEGYTKESGTDDQTNRDYFRSLPSEQGPGRAYQRHDP